MKKIDQLILLIGIVLMIIGVYYVERKPNSIPSPSPIIPVIIPDVIPEPVPVPVPKPNVPDLVSNIVYDDCEAALKLSRLHNRSLVLIFSADWCGYCKDLKKDIASIKPLDKTIICVLDIEKNSQLVDKYKIKGLPTSVIIVDNKEQSRKSGYKKNDYETWLNGNL